MRDILEDLKWTFFTCAIVGGLVNVCMVENPLIKANMFSMNYILTIAYLLTFIAHASWPTKGQ